MLEKVLGKSPSVGKGKSPSVGKSVKVISVPRVRPKKILPKLPGLWKDTVSFVLLILVAAQDSMKSQHCIWAIIQNV